MPQVIEERAGVGSAMRQTLRGLWPSLAALGLGLMALGMLFLPEIRAAVQIWDSSTAYGHCYLVLPMALYLIWDRRGEIAAVPLRAEPGFALLALPIAAAWLGAERLGIMEGRQLMALAAIEVLLLTVLGRRMFWALSGPLLYLFFLVPFGAFLTPFLQHFTARFSAIGLDLLGIPNYTDDLIIEIPAGTFFVAEACAGLRFLIAAVAFGVFYALLNYRRPVRRLVFIAASIVVPIIANGFRALGIVVLGNILGSAEAAAADHVIYGWVFFSFVMLLLVAAGMPLREAPGTAPAMAGRPAVRRGPAPLWGALAAAALAALGPATAALLNTRAVAATLAALPEWRLPSGCALQGQSAALGPAGLTVTCGERVFEIAVHGFPARSTPAGLIAQSRQATGELGAEDTSIVSLAVADPRNGEWTLVQTTQPFRTTAFASWVDGAPARGGLYGRLRQARDSVLGSEYAPVLITIATSEPGRMTAEQQQTMLRSLRALIDAQTDLSAQMATVSRQD